MNETLILWSTLLVITLAGSLSTFWLDTTGHFNKVQASSLTTFLFSAILYLFHNTIPLPLTYPLLTAAWFGSSFIGMTTSKIASYKTIALASIVFTLLFLTGQTYFKSFGGKLGLMACIAVVVAVGGDLVKKYWNSLLNK